MVGIAEIIVRDEHPFANHSSPILVKNLRSSLIRSRSVIPDGIGWRTARIPNAILGIKES